MITNGTYLNKINLSKLIELGLTELQVSIDTVDSTANDQTRKNTNLSIITDNLITTMKNHSDLHLTFSTVINSVSIHGIDNLLDFGESIGVSTYIFREVWDFLDEGEATRHGDFKDWIQNITLKSGEFGAMQRRLEQHHAFRKIQFFPADTQAIAKELQKK